MINQQVLDGKWHELAGRLKAKWGQLADDDLRTFNGDVEQLIGRIQQKTGETREAVERFLDQLTDEGAGVSRASETRLRKPQARQPTAPEKVTKHFARVMQRRRKLSNSVRDKQSRLHLGWVCSEDLAWLCCFVTGITNAIRPQGRAAAEHIGRQMLDALAGIIPDSLTKKPHS